jgi:hypothetical protein
LAPPGRATAWQARASFLENAESFFAKPSVVSSRAARAATVRPARLLRKSAAKFTVGGWA